VKLKDEKDRWEEQVGQLDEGRAAPPPAPSPRTQWSTRTFIHVCWLSYSRWFRRPPDPCHVRREPRPILPFPAHPCTGTRNSSPDGAV